MLKALFSQIARALLKVIPESTKGFLFNESFFSMKESTRDSWRLWFYRQIPNQGHSLRMLKEKGFNPKITIDCGAYEGKWTDMVKQIFTDTYVLMIEALPEKQEILEKVKRKYAPTVDYVIALLGAAEKNSVTFYKHESGSSVLEDKICPALPSSSLRMQTLDNVLSKAGIDKTDCLKLDVQGYKLDVLNGAKQALKTASVVLMEVSISARYKGEPLIKEVLEFMDGFDYKTYEICEMHRSWQNMNVLRQVDIIFVRKNSEYSLNPQQGFNPAVIF